jgi:hypothetical protein
MICMTCGDTVAVNGQCFHSNPNPVRLMQEWAKRDVKRQIVACPDCAAVLRIYVDAEGLVHILGAEHQS